MNQRRRKRPEQRRTNQPQRPAADMWRSAGPLPDVAPITVPDDVSALLRSLGDPPIAGGGVRAGHYFSAAIERAAAVAAALAVSADLLAQPIDGQEPPVD